MSHFALLRQRIAVIQSIHKTTSAMRLIAMSIQSRLKKKELAFKNYTDLLAQVEAAYRAQTRSASALMPPCEERAPLEAVPPLAPIVIIIGSQKSLCGSFNEKLWEYIGTTYPTALSMPCITIGAHATQQALRHGIQPHVTYDDLSSATLIKIAQQLTQFLRRSSWRQAILFNNRPRTFFIQEPHQQLLAVPPPLSPERVSVLHGPASSKRIDSYPQIELENYLTTLHIQNSLIQALHDSLLAEQAARFLSMDTATRNADELLHQTRLEYNKARQAYVTRELIELTSSYNAD